MQWAFDFYLAFRHFDFFFLHFSFLFLCTFWLILVERGFVEIYSNSYEMTSLRDSPFFLLSFSISYSIKCVVPTGYEPQVRPSIRLATAIIRKAKEPSRHDVQDSHHRQKSY